MRNSLLLVIGSVAFTYVLWIAGCGPQEAEFKEYEPQGEVADLHEHDHHHEHGPHDGHLIELGEEEYHAELVFDEQTRKITVYVLDSEGKNPVAIDQTEITLNLTADGQPVQLTLAATPLEGEAEGTSSRFELAADQLPDSIHHEEDLEGRLNLSIAGTPFVGEITHEHDEHDHEEHHDDEK